MPGIDITQTCAATGRQVSTTTTPAHPILLVIEVVARLQAGHLPNPIFEAHKFMGRQAGPIWGLACRDCP